MPASTCTRRTFAMAALGACLAGCTTLREITYPRPSTIASGSPG